MIANVLAEAISSHFDLVITTYSVLHYKKRIEGENIPFSWGMKRQYHLFRPQWTNNDFYLKSRICIQFSIFLLYFNTCPIYWRVLFNHERMRKQLYFSLLLLSILIFFDINNTAIKIYMMAITTMQLLYTELRKLWHNEYGYFVKKYITQTVRQSRK